jgi:outer membrane protein assembly factor BamB
MIQPKSVKWQFKTAGRVVSSPVVVGGVVYIGSADRALYAVDAKSGQQLWRFETRGAVNSTACISDGMLYFVSGDGCCYALDSTTGKLRWQFQTLGEKVYDTWDYYLSSPAVDNGVVYFGSGDGNVYALDAVSGAKRWAFQTRGVVHASPAIADNAVYIGSFDGSFYALDAVTGELRWRFKTVGDRWFPKGEVQGSAAVAGGTVFFGSRDYNVYALDARTGTGLWNRKIANTWVISTPAIKDGVIFLGTSDGHTFEAMDAESGAVRWTFPVNLNVFSSPGVAGDTVYFGCFNGMLYALDAATGKERWRYATPASSANCGAVLDATGAVRPEVWGKGLAEAYDTILSLGSVLSSPAVADGVVYFGSADGYLYALE